MILLSLMKPLPGKIPLLSLASPSPLGSAEFPAVVKTTFRRPRWLITIDLTFQESLDDERRRELNV